MNFFEFEMKLQKKHEINIQLRITNYELFVLKLFKYQRFFLFYATAW